MKTHTQAFKNNIKLMGKELDSKIIYGLTELGSEDLNSVSPHYEGGILKSVMKQLDIDSNVDIPLETNLEYKLGLKVNNQYEYISFGKYIVYNVEKQEDTESYKITCYDKLLKSMIPYVDLGITYPITIRDYLIAICNYLDIDFANATDTFTNYNKEIPYELYLDANGNDLGYTFRDVLDELAQATASTICINNDDELEIKYIQETNDVVDEEYLKDVNVKFGQKYGPINAVVLSRSADSDSIARQDTDSIELNGLCEIKISENQLMNFNDRDTYLDEIFSQLNGLEYYINDYKSTGIGYLDLCDRYNVVVGENTYSCVMFNDEVIVTQGLEENIFTEMPDESKTDYTKTDKTDRKLNQAISMVDKQNLVITNLVSETQSNQQLNDSRILELTERTNAVEQNITSTQATIEVMQRDIVNGKETLQNSLVTIDINGINVSTNASAIATLMTNEKFVIKSGDTTLAFFGYDSDENVTKAEMNNLTITKYLVAGWHRVEKFERNGENRTGWFYLD